MFERHREKKAAEQAQAALAQWQQQRDAQAELVQVASTYTGEATSDGLVLKPGESLYATVSGASLVEERRGRGEFVAGSRGVSIPVGSIGGHAVRYHVGQTRGHYVQAPPMPTAIDTGTVYVTDQRVIFSGSRQSRECAYAKLLTTHFDPAGECTLSVSNRQKPTVLHYGAQLAGWFQFRVQLALAHFHGTTAAFIDELQKELADLDAHKPTQPAIT